MFRVVPLCLLFIASTCSLQAQEEDQFKYSYLSGSAGWFNSNDDNIRSDLNHINVAGAYHFNKRWGIELGYTHGLGHDSKVCNSRNQEQCLTWDRNITALTFAPQYSFYSRTEFWRANMKLGLAYSKVDYDFVDHSTVNLFWKVDNQFKTYYKGFRFGFGIGQFKSESPSGDQYYNTFTDVSLTYEF